MKQITGLVMELKEKTCIILTRSGEFREVRRSLQEVRLGDEISSAPAETAAAAWWKPLLAAASVFLFLWGGFLYYGWSNEAVAYVGLDLNPSVELGINRRQQVCQVSGLDAEGRVLVQKVTLRGLPLDAAITAVVTEAIAERYLNPAGENVILTTVTVGKKSRVNPDPQQISRWIQGILQRSGVRAEVVVEEAPAEVRRQAKEAGLSTGKYLQRMRGSGKKGLPGPGGVAGPPQKNAAGQEEKGPLKATDFTVPGKALLKGTPGTPGKEEKEAGKKGAERGAPREERQKEGEAKKRLDEIRLPLRNLFPAEKRTLDERSGNDREQDGDDNKVKTSQTNGRSLLDKATGPGPDWFFEHPETGQKKPPSIPLPGDELELPKVDRKRFEAQRQKDTKAEAQRGANSCFQGSSP